MQLVIAAAVTKYETRTVSEEQMAEVRRAKAEWDGTRQVVADKQDQAATAGLRGS